MKKTAVFILISCLLMITGCRQSEVEESMKSLTDDTQAILEVTETLADRITVLEENNQILSSLIDEQVTILSHKLDERYFTLPIYHTDINTSDVRVQYYVMIQNDLSLKDKVKTLADKLSSYSFDGLPIELLKIETIDNGSKIAIINLIDSEDRVNSALRKTWSGNYFQGSFGGSATTSKLERTFLQDDYKGEWIDGVKFLYNNDETNNFEHIGEFIGKVHYRD